MRSMFHIIYFHVYRILRGAYFYLVSMFYKTVIPDRRASGGEPRCRARAPAFSDPVDPKGTVSASRLRRRPLPLFPYPAICWLQGWRHSVRGACTIASTCDCVLLLLRQGGGAPLANAAVPRCGGSSGGSSSAASHRLGAAPGHPDRDPAPEPGTPSADGSSNRPAIDRIDPKVDIG